MDIDSEIQELLEGPITLLSENELEEKLHKIITLLGRFPSSKEIFKVILENVLGTLGRHFESIGQYSKLLTSYHYALTAYADHEGVLSNLGAHLMRAGHLETAAGYFEEALKVNVNHLPALRNLETFYNISVERWHFRMLNDSTRNRRFKEAISKRVQQGFDRVLDIGTGTGIFCLYANEAKAKEIYACETSKAMVGIATKVFVKNKVGTKVNLKHRLSNSLTIPTDIPRRVSLVVTETLDIGLVGENILQTLIHAWDNLLLPSSTGIKMYSQSRSLAESVGYYSALEETRNSSNGTVLTKATVSYKHSTNANAPPDSEMPFETESSRSFAVKLHYPCNSSINSDSEELFSFSYPSGTHETGCVIPLSALTWITAVESDFLKLKYRAEARHSNHRNLPESSSFKKIDCQDILSYGFFACDGTEYDSVDLQQVPHYRFLSEPTKCMEINFNNRDEMKLLLEGCEKEITLLCTKKGQVDAFVMWFDLKLDEDIELTSAPIENENRAKCWEQAVFPLSYPVNTQENYNLILKVGCKNGKMSVKLCSVFKPNDLSAPSTSKSNPNSSMQSLLLQANGIESILDSACYFSSNSEAQSYAASYDVIRFLNDLSWINCLNEALELFVHAHTNANHLNLLDLSPFPLFGLAVLARSLNEKKSQRCTLTCIAYEAQDRNAIAAIAKEHNIGDDLLNFMDGSVDEAFDQASQFDLILIHPIESSGRLYENFMVNLPLFK